MREVSTAGPGRFCGERLNSSDSLGAAVLQTMGRRHCMRQPRGCEHACEAIVLSSPRPRARQAAPRIAALPGGTTAGPATEPGAQMWPPHKRSAFRPPQDLPPAAGVHPPRPPSSNRIARTNSVQPWFEPQGAPVCHTAATFKTLIFCVPYVRIDGEVARLTNGCQFYRVWSEAFLVHVMAAPAFLVMAAVVAFHRSASSVHASCGPGAACFGGTFGRSFCARTGLSNPAKQCELC